MKIINKISTHLWLHRYGVKNYILLEDQQYGYIVAVEGDVDLSRQELTYIPIQFGKVNGHFSCSDNQLTSLKGGPTSVGGNFSCHSNKLTSLQGGSTSVGGHFSCSYNQLTSLIGGPTSVGGDFYCNNNELTNLEHSPTSVGGSFHCSNNEGLGEYQDITDFNLIKEKILSDREKKALLRLLDGSHLKGAILKL